ncbi:phage baseplate assembly protein [Gluconobacter japonicus]|uniref:phage baseplate assembly protein n=1 Tax=Gluconobacter japonicus TaxID=376620 RepID=UPI003D26B146
MSESVTAHARNWIVRVNGKAIHNWTTCEAGIDLADLAGVFRFTLAEKVPEDSSYKPTVKMHDAVEIEIHNTVVLRGFVEGLNPSGSDRALSVVVSGRDKTGDLVDCTANPVGPAEYRKIALETVVGHLANPYGVTVSRQVETGAPFTLVALEQTDTVLGAVERLSRQRGVLVTSDGLGKLLLTKAGTTRVQDRLVYPGGNVSGMQAQISQRHSDVYVKGQFNSVLRGSKSALNVGSVPGQTTLTTGHRAKELGASCRIGHCVDPGVGRYRPIVHMAKTQSGASAETQNSANPTLDSVAQGQGTTAPAGNAAYQTGTRAPKRKRTRVRQAADPWSLQDQADWRYRTARAHSEAFVYTVPGVLDASGALWRPNMLIPVQDWYNGLNGDMLIGAVTWVNTGHGEETRISVVPPDAYDLSGEADTPPTSGRRKTTTGTSWGKS